MKKWARWNERRSIVEASSRNEWVQRTARGILRASVRLREKVLAGLDRVDGELTPESKAEWKALRGELRGLYSAREVETWLRGFAGPEELARRVPVLAGFAEPLRERVPRRARVPNRLMPEWLRKWAPQIACYREAQELFVCPSPPFAGVNEVMKKLYSKGAGWRELRRRKAVSGKW